MGPGSPSGVTSARGRRSQSSSFPAPDEVHVWVADLDSDPVESARRVAATTDGERERASRFRRPSDAERYLSAHGALRLVLAEYLGCDPVALRLGARDNGKPFLEDASLEFNLSHSGALALIAVARSRQVGIDVELIRPISDLVSLAARVCTPGELATLTALAEPHRQRAFFAMWTRKEALAKATGEGISAVVRDASTPVVDGEARWTLIEMSDFPGYAACVAAEGLGCRLVRRDVTGSNGRP